MLHDWIFWSSAGQILLQLKQPQDVPMSNNLTVWLSYENANAHL